MAAKRADLGSGSGLARTNDFDRLVHSERTPDAVNVQIAGGCEGRGSQYPVRSAEGHR